MSFPIMRLCRRRRALRHGDRFNRKQVLPDAGTCAPSARRDRVRLAGQGLIGTTKVDTALNCAFFSCDVPLGALDSDRIFRRSRLRSSAAAVIDRSELGRTLMQASRLSPRRVSFVGATVFATLALAPATVFAQQPSSDCVKGGELFKARIGWIQKIQALPKKKTDPLTACSLFNGLSGANARVLSWAKSNKDWCSIEDQQIAGLEAESANVGNIRAKACAAAAQFSKLKSQAEKAAKNRQDDAFSVDMHSDPLAPPVKIPPSAL
jgi:hypothetical protein